MLPSPWSKSFVGRRRYRAASDGRRQTHGREKNEAMGKKFQRDHRAGIHQDLAPCYYLHHLLNVLISVPASFFFIRSLIHRS